MATANRVLANFDARISEIKIIPENKTTKIVIESKMHDQLSGESKIVKIVFSDVAAIDFRINFFAKVYLFCSPILISYRDFSYIEYDGMGRFWTTQHKAALCEFRAPPPEKACSLLCWQDFYFLHFFVCVIFNNKAVSI